MLFPRFQLNLNYGMHFISSNSQILESTSKGILIPSTTGMMISLAFGSNCVKLSLSWVDMFLR